MMSAFNQYLGTLGATREEIKGINDSINEMVFKADVIQEDMSDKIALLKKVEIKVHELAEKRKVFQFWEPEVLYSREKEIR